jgi:peptide/nickel transport system permease protein
VHVGQIASDPGDGAGPVGDDHRELTARSGASPRRLAWRRFRRDRLAVAGLVVVVLLVAVAVFAPLIVRAAGAPPPDFFDHRAQDQFGQPTGPSHAHILGVDSHGGDVFSRTIYGARVSLTVALSSTAIALVIGTIVGLYAGFYRGWADSLLSRVTDLVLAFPVLLLALGIGSACSDPRKGCVGGHLKPGEGLVTAVIAFATWPYVARLVRGQVMSLREKEFIEAARAFGASDRRIMFSELLPNLAAPVIVYASVLIPQNVLFEAALSFLGVGVRFPQPSWGEMLSDAAPIFDQAWWFMLFPGLALLVTVLAFNFVGDGLRDALDPRAAMRPGAGP